MTGDELWSRRMFLTTQAMLMGASIFEATEAASSLALDHPDWDMDERRTYAEWEVELFTS